MTNNPYEQWVAERRDVSPPAALVDQIMSDAEHLERQRHQEWWLRWIMHIERRRAVRWGVYCGALVIGSLPFVFFARVAPL